jgi:hypothetical protein
MKEKTLGQVVVCVDYLISCEKINAAIDAYNKEGTPLKWDI